MAPTIARPRRGAPVLVCTKCMRRAPGGKRIGDALRASLKARRSEDGGRRPKLVATKCLGLCPKRAVAVTGGRMLAAGRMLILRSEADAVEAVEMMAEP